MRMVRERGPSTRAEMSKSIGITLSDTECVVASAGLDGVIAEGCTRSFLTPSTYDALLVKISSTAKELMLQEEKSTLCLGVSIPGIVDYQEQRAVISANLPLLNGKPIGADLQKLLGVDCLILRDVHAFSLSERLLHGKGEANSNVAMLDHSEGIGLGLMVNKQFLSGINGFSGELGHISIVADGVTCNCGKKGCLETVASEWALEAKTSEVLGRPIKLKELLELAKAGDERVLKELEQMCEYLALGLAIVINIFNPGTFYVYGECFRELPQLLDLLVEKTKQHTLEPSFTACEFAHASSGELDGTIASVINYLTDSLVPDLDDYAGIAEA